MSRRPRVLLGLALATALTATVVWLVAVHLTAGRELDARALQSFEVAAQPRLVSSIDGIARLANPIPLLIGAVVLVLVALLRRRPLMAAAIPVILGAANATTQLLKPALGDLRVVDTSYFQQVYSGSWPSGHSTAAMSLALCGVLAVGPRLRPLAALLGAGYAIAVGYALVVLGHHLPSDVFGGYLVSATFTLLGVAALAVLEARAPARLPVAKSPPSGLSAPVLALTATMCAALFAIVLLIGRPSQTLDAMRHTSAVVVAIAIAGLGLTLTGGLARVLRR